MAEIKSEDKNVKGSLMVKGRKSIAYLQKLKDEGTPIVQMCPAIRDQFWVMAAEMAGCDVCRLTVPGDGTANMEWQSHLAGMVDPHRSQRRKADPHQLLHGYYDLCLQGEGRGDWRSLHVRRRGSLLPMGVTNETLKYMADNWLVVFGHVGAVCPDGTRPHRAATSAWARPLRTP